MQSGQDRYHTEDELRVEVQRRLDAIAPGFVAQCLFHIWDLSWHVSIYNPLPPREGVPINGCFVLDPLNMPDDEALTERCRDAIRVIAIRAGA